MSKNPYDQFFKAAKATRSRETRTVPARPKLKAKPTTSSQEEALRVAFQMSRRRKKPFPVMSLVSGVALLLLASLYLAQPDWVDRQLRRVQIGMIGQVVAEEKPAAKPTDTPAKDAGAKAEVKKVEGQPEVQPVPEDASYIEKLRVRKEELDLREKELNQLEEELQRQKVEVDNRVRQLEQMRRDIASHLKERVDADETQINKLVDLYSTMKPKQAADVIGSLQEDLAVQVLGKMKKKNAAEVMNLLPADKARGLSERLTGYKR